MAIAFVSSDIIPGGSSGGTSAGINTTGANLLVVSTSWFITDVIPTDSLGNTWIEAITESAASFGVSLYYCINPTVGVGQTFTLAGGQFNAGSVHAFSGVSAIGGTTIGTSAGSGTSVQPGSLTPSVNGSLLVAAISESAAPTGNSVAVDSSFTGLLQQPFTSGTFFGNAQAYLIQATAAAVNPTFSWTGSASAVNAAQIYFTPSASSTFSITGSAGVAAATISWTGTSSGSTTADGSGNYTIPSLANGTYTVTPTLTGYTFSPTNHSVTISGGNQTGVNFTATQNPTNTLKVSPADVVKIVIYNTQTDGTLLPASLTPIASTPKVLPTTATRVVLYSVNSDGTLSPVTVASN